jgi:hypothetical protein
VTFGRGEACVDRPILDFLLSGRRPASRSLECDGDVADPYVPLSPRSARDFDDAMEAMVVTENELFADPDYVLWDGESEVRVGCREGGFVTIIPETLQDAIRFVDCRLVPDYPIVGNGTFVFDTNTVSWSVTVPDGQLDYRVDDVRRTVSGTWKGQPVDLSE